MTTNDLIRVLLIEDNPGDARLIRDTLAQMELPRFELAHVDRLATGLARLAQDDVDVVLLDLSLPDSQGLATLVECQANAPRVPIVVLTGLADEATALKALQQGAQDYLVKGKGNDSLARVLRYAIERQRLQEELRALSLADELTGLRNPRGFRILAEQALKSAHRTWHGLLLSFVDVDKLKKINDTLGHAQGNAALIETAILLKETFRESDILARLGGDEFGVLTVETAEDSAHALTARLQKNLADHNARADRLYLLALSIGIARYTPEIPCSIDELLARADQLMYEDKKRKRKL